MTRPRWALLLLCLIGAFSAKAQAQDPSRNLVLQPAVAQTAASERRIALVIGNNAYKDAPLINPVNDARAMAEALRGAGFEVALHTDISHREFLVTLREFGDRLRGSGAGLFYFAGHGMQIKGRNYLIPVGAAIEREDEVAYAAVDAQAILDKMEAAGTRTNLLILDACRNNPFARSFRSSTQGLAQMDAPVGTLVAFATAPGAVASDGQGRNGLYTQHMLEALRRPGLKVEDVFKQTRAAVRRDSQGKQVPWEATSLEGDFYFLAPVAPLASPGPPAAGNLLRSNAQGYTVGDKWNYQLIDKGKGEVVRNEAVRVGSIAPDGSWLATGGAEYDEHGRLRKWLTASERRQCVPHCPRWWPGMKVGETQRLQYEYSAKSADGKSWVNILDGESRVVGIESIKVPAGEFRAYRIEHKGTMKRAGASGVGTFSLKYWYAPELRFWVAHEEDTTWNGQMGRSERAELTSFSLVQRPAPR